MPLPTAYKGQIVKLSDLVVTKDAVERVSFENCLIVGPAIMAPAGETRIASCSFTAPGGARNFFMIYDEDADYLPPGLIPVVDCTFNDCQFIRISMAGPEYVRDRILAGIFG